MAFPIMEIGQLQAMAAQMLQNYHRCGVRFVARGAANQLPASVLQQLAVLLAENSVPPVNVTHSGTISKTQSPSAAYNRNEIPASSVSRASSSSMPSPPAVVQSSTAVRPAANTSTLLAGNGSWTLPVIQSADRPDKLAELNAQVDACRLCAEIVNYRQRTVFGAGDLQPTVCFMGEAPGADEDRTGQPFVGKAGQLLTKIIAAMKLSRDEVYILNALKCRPPQNRTPVAVEIDACRSFVENQLEILQPKYIVCLGAVAVRSLLRDEGSIGRLRGRFHSYKGAKVVVTYHPSYLLRQESAKRMVWEDMQMLMRDMGTLS